MQITKQMVRSGMQNWKKNLQSLGEKISHNTNNSELQRQLLRDKNKSFKQACRRKKREYISKGMSNINMQKTPKRLTVDSIFTLKMLVDKHVKSKPHKHRNLLFSCFVNFRKAFDCIPQQKLFNKLIKRRYLRTFLKRFNIHVLKW